MFGTCAARATNSPTVLLTDDVLKLHVICRCHTSQSSYSCLGALTAAGLSGTKGLVLQGHNLAHVLLSTVPFIKCPLHGQLNTVGLTKIFASSAEPICAQSTHQAVALSALSVQRSSHSSSPSSSASSSHLMKGSASRRNTFLPCKTRCVMSAKEALVPSRDTQNFNALK